MSQYVPDVTEADIERVLRRDYPPELHPVIRQLIADIEVTEKLRVVMACLKNGNGNFQKLEGELKNASGWWREILSEAEYPNYTRKWFRIHKLSEEERQRIIQKDKNQYLAWLRR